MKFIHIACILFFSISTRGQDTGSLIRKIVNSSNYYDKYKITFEKWIKYKSKEDTIYSLINGMVMENSNFPEYGIYTVKSDNQLLNVSLNHDELLKLDSSTNCYYSSNKSIDGEESFRIQVWNYNFHPLSYNYDFLKNFEIDSISDVNFYKFNKIDSTLDQFNNIKKTRIQLYIRKSDLFPEIQEVWSWFDGGLQYSGMRIIKIELLNINTDFFRQYTDSVTFRIKQNINGDSLDLELRNKYKKLKIGDSVPSTICRYAGLNDSINVTRTNDSIIILDFFYTSCNPCVLSIPSLNNIFKNYSNKGVRLFSLNPYSYDWQNIKHFRTFFKIEYPILEIDKKYTYQYGVFSFPRIIIIKNGTVVFIHRGFENDLQNIIETELDKLLNL